MIFPVIRRPSRPDSLLAASKPACIARRSAKIHPYRRRRHRLAVPSIGQAVSPPRSIL